MNSTTQNSPLMAASLVLLAMALFGLVDNFIKVLAQDGGLWQFHLIRAGLALCILAGIARLRNIRLWPKRAGAVLLRSGLSATAMLIYFGCLGFMPIAQVVAGLFTAPIWVLIFSVVFFGERVGVWRVGAALLGFAGTVLVLQPDAGSLTIASIFPTIAGAVYALGNLATRRWCAGEGTLTLLAGFFVLMGAMGACGVVVLALHPLPVLPGGDGFLTRGWVTPTATFLIWTVVQGVASIVGVGFTIRAYQLAEASFVAVFEYSLLVSATLWAILLWAEVPDLSTTLGIAAILVSGVAIAIRSNSPADDRAARLPA
ncbi:DMT family transporter [Pseudogemmobacter sp. W21_MBD1_M6]|uniref:DMT family transporter n=1 Tax=Pseudogemmobacter sp. W21_MBD1_M6 TaxID=3240271 RepID=UPI003F96BB16